MNIVPKNGYVVIEEIIQSSTTESGFEVGEDSVTPTDQGTIFRVDALFSNDYKEGDKIVFKRYLFEEVRIGQKGYLVGQVSNIIAKLEE